jgi:hypothetical protein
MKAILEFELPDDEDTVKLDAAKINEYVKAVKADIEWKLAIENGDVE